MQNPSPTHPHAHFIAEGSASYASDEINIVDLIQILFRYRYFILIAVFLSLLGAYFAVLRPGPKKTVVSATLLIPAQAAKLDLQLIQNRMVQALAREPGFGRLSGNLNQPNKKDLDAAMQRLDRSLKMVLGTAYAKGTASALADTQALSISVTEADENLAFEILNAATRSAESQFVSFQKELSLSSVSVAVEKTPENEILRRYLFLDETLKNIVSAEGLKDYYRVTDDSAAVDLLKSRMTYTDAQGESILRVQDLKTEVASRIIKRFMASMARFDVASFSAQTGMLSGAKTTLYPHAAAGGFKDFLTSNSLVDKIVQKHNLVKHYGTTSVEQARQIVLSRLKIEIKNIFLRDLRESPETRQLPIVGVATGNGIKEMIMPENRDFVQISFQDSQTKVALAALSSFVEHLNLWLGELGESAENGKGLTLQGHEARASYQWTAGLPQAQLYVRSRAFLLKIISELNLEKKYQETYSLRGLENVLQRLNSHIDINVADGIWTLSVQEQEGELALQIINNISLRLKNISFAEFASAVEFPFEAKLILSPLTLSDSTLVRLFSAKNLQTLHEMSGASVPWSENIRVNLEKRILFSKQGTSFVSLSAFKYKANIDLDPVELNSNKTVLLNSDAPDGFLLKGKNLEELKNMAHWIEKTMSQMSSNDKLLTNVFLDKEISNIKEIFPLHLNPNSEPYLMSQGQSLRYLDKPTVASSIPEKLNVRVLRGPFQDNDAGASASYQLIEQPHFDSLRTSELNKNPWPIFGAVVFGCFFAACIIAFGLDFFRKIGHVLAKEKAL